MVVEVVEVTTVVAVVVIVVDVPFGKLITHRRPWADFLHWYLTFFAMRKEPAFTHFDPTICGAALETDETYFKVNDEIRRGSLNL